MAVSMALRLEVVGDEPGIQAVHRACFPTPTEADLVDALRRSGRLSISLVAWVDHRIVGHVAFSPVTTSTGHIGLGLAPVAVLPAHQRRGIAAALIREGQRLCVEQNCGWTVVLGDPAYYLRFGYRPAREFGLSDLYHGGDAFQALELSPGSIPKNAGLVRYAPEFDVFG